MALHLWVFVSAVLVVLVVKYNATASNSQDESCKVSEDEIDILASSLKKSILEIGIKENVISDSSCNSIKLASVQSTGTNLVLQEKLLRKLEHLDPQAFLIIKQGQIGQLASFNRLIDLLKQTLVSGWSNRPQKFYEVLNTFQEKVNDASGVSQYEMEDYKTRAIQMIASYIRSTEYDNALKYYEILISENEENKDQILSDIIHWTYNKNLRNFNGVIKFLNKLPSCEQFGVASSAILENMRTNNHLNTPKILLASVALMKCGAKAVEKIERYVDNIIMSWVRKIKAGIFEDILKNFKLCECGCESWEIDIYNTYLPKIVHNVYNQSVSNFNATMTFIDYLPSMLSRFYGYDALFKELTNSGHRESYETLQLSHRIKTDMTNNSSKHIVPTKNLEFMFKNLLDSLPQTLRQIIWEEECTIRNELYGEYLYSENATESKYYESLNVFLRKNHGGMDDEMFKWKFETLENATKFYIVNSFWSKQNRGQGFLSIHEDDYFDIKRMNVWTVHILTYALMFSVRGAWKIHPINGKFRITRTDMHGVGIDDIPIYAEESSYNFDRARRRVFAWVDGTARSGDIWDISCS